MNKQTAQTFGIEDFSIENLMLEFQSESAKEIIDVSPRAMPHEQVIAPPAQPVSEAIAVPLQVPAKKQEAEPKEAKPPEENAFDFTNDIEFDVRFKGYDRLQVDDYIDKLTLDYNKMCEKFAEIEQENKGLRRTLSELYRLRDEKEVA